MSNNPLSFGQFAWMPMMEEVPIKGEPAPLPGPVTYTSSTPGPISSKILYLVSRCKAALEFDGNKVIWQDEENRSEEELDFRYTGRSHQSTPVCLIAETGETIEEVVDRTISLLSDIHREDDTAVPQLTPYQQDVIQYFFKMLPHRLGNSVTFELEINGHKTMYQSVYEELHGGYGIAPVTEGFVCKEGETQIECCERISQGDVLYELTLIPNVTTANGITIPGKRNRWISDNLFDVINAGEKYFAAREV